MRRYEHGGDVYGNDGILLDFSVNTNPLGMPAAVRQAVIDHIPEYVRYPDPSCRALRSTLAARHGLDSSMVLCGNGAAELIFALCASLKPQNALILAPTFSEYERAVLLYGGAVSGYHLAEADGFALTERILPELTPRTDMFFLCNPNNPSGRLADPALLCEIAEACGRNGTLLILDECFIDFTMGKSMLRLLTKYPKLMILQAFTKTYAMAGLRLGVLYGADERLIAHVAEFCPTWSVSAVAQAAGMAALTAEGWIESTRRVVESERAFVTDALHKPGLSLYQSDANFLLLKSGKPLYEPLKQRGILVRSCANFSGLDGRYIRVGLKTHNENLALADAVEEVLNG